MVDRQTGMEWERAAMNEIRHATRAFRSLGLIRALPFARGPAELVADFRIEAPTFAVDPAEADHLFAAMMAEHGRTGVGSEAREHDTENRV
jgi:hypothetical protein